MAKYKSESGQLFDTIAEAEQDNLRFSQALTLTKTALKLNLIPTRNRVHVIDNYSPNYDYIVEGNKVYYSLKGKDHWVDISNSTSTQKGLMSFLHDNYNFMGYEDGEADIYNRLMNPETPKTKLMTLAQIPTKNRTNVINNFAKDYDYIVEGNKVYRSKKGEDGWADISSNKHLLKLLLAFLHNNYNFTGYEDGEADLYNKMIGNRTPQPTTKAGVTLPSVWDFRTPAEEWTLRTLDWVHLLGLAPLPSKPVTKSAAKPRSKAPAKLQPQPRILTTGGPYAPGFAIEPVSLKVKNPGDMGTAWNMLVDGEFGRAFNYVSNGLSRKLAKYFPDDEVSSMDIPKLPITNSKYNLVDGSFTGDTISLAGVEHALPGQYLLPENINLKDVKLGVRNRGDYRDIKTEGGIATGFHAFVPWRLGLRAGTYIGVDSQGHFKAGDLSQFGPGDRLSRTFSNEITSFKKDASGKIVTKPSPKNTPLHYPVTVLPDGREGSLPALVDAGDTSRYGRILGGRFVVRVGNELRLLSGSVDNISLQFEEMKRRHGVSSGTFYTLDNGSYNTGLRMRSGTITSGNLRSYDDLNASGGNFLYLEPNQQFFPSDTIWTPNIRTKQSESYLKGHGLTNELTGVILHHTAFTDEDLTNVTNHLLDPAPEGKPDKAVSAHVIIGYDGFRRVLARPDLVTFHAGHSVWNGRTDVNDFMVGIEFLGDTDKKDLTDELIQSAIEYLKPIIRKNNITLENIVTHEQVRDLYNEYARKLGVSLVDHKPDISLKSYLKILLALKEQLYYPKKYNGGRLVKRNRFVQ